MDKVPSRNGRRWPRALRPILARPRLSASTLSGVLAFFLIPHSLNLTARGLLAWDIGAALFLILSLHLMTDSDLDMMRRRALRHDEGRNYVLLLAVIAAAASVTAIATELASAKGQVAHLELLHVLFTVVTITLSWAFVQIIFALHYASIYYSRKDAGKTASGHCLIFPGDQLPDYWDLLYFAVIVGVTGQTADVGIASREMRHIVTVHSLLSFAFNTAVLALMVNLAAGLF